MGLFYLLYIAVVLFFYTLFSLEIQFFFLFFYRLEKVQDRVLYYLSLYINDLTNIMTNWLMGLQGKKNTIDLSKGLDRAWEEFLNFRRNIIQKCAGYNSCIFTKFYICFISFPSLFKMFFLRVYTCICIFVSRQILLDKRNFFFFFW